jgi:hypothetical protein
MVVAALAAGVIGTEFGARCLATARLRRALAPVPAIAGIKMMVSA